MAAEIADPRVGQKHPIDVLPDGRIVDGRSRELACLVAGVTPQYTTVRLTDAEIPQFVRAKNLTRRHPSDSQLAMIAVGWANLSRGDNQFTARPEDIEVASQEATSPRPVSQAEAAEFARRVQKFSRGSCGSARLVPSSSLFTSGSEECNTPTPSSGSAGRSPRGRSRARSRKRNGRGDSSLV